jgi:hypothetical protein
MIGINGKKLRIGLGILGVAVLMLTATPALAGQNRPTELRGKVTGVAGDRIQISLSQQQWLPPAGITVSFGEEMAGMFVALKGKFVIIQVNADSCMAQAVGSGERGKPAAGMTAIMKIPSWEPPIRRSDYVNKFKNQSGMKVLQMARGGNKLGQHMVAMSYHRVGDHDNALAWWGRALKGAREPTIIQHGSTVSAKILALRGEFNKALAILKNAASRLAPHANDMVFSSYFSLTGRGIESYVSLLKEIGSFYRIHFKNMEESKRWYRRAAKVMTTCATKGAPKPGDAAFRNYKMLLNSLVIIQSRILKDNKAAVPWLQILAKSGDKSAQKTLADMGLSW